MDSTASTYHPPTYTLKLGSAPLPINLMSHAHARVQETIFPTLKSKQEFIWVDRKRKDKHDRKSNPVARDCSMTLLKSCSSSKV